MTIEIKVPDLPESVSDATISAWHKKPGDSVKRDENLVDLETDKVVLEVPAPADGTIKEIKQAEGATVNAQDIIAIFEEGNAKAAPTSNASKAAAPEAVVTPAPAKAAPQPKVPSPSAASGDVENLSPSVRRMVQEQSVDPSKITGTGKDGRITKQDVIDFVGGKSSQSSASTAPAVPRVPAATGGRPEERVPMSRLRAKVAERLLAAKQGTAMLTTFNEVDMSAVMGMRSRYKDIFQKKHDVKLGFMSFFVKACIDALKQFPSVNASIDGSDIIYHGYYDIGVAVSTDRGLVVPVLRDVDQMSMADIEKQISDFAVKARDGKLGIDDMQGGTFTLSNGGIFGSLLSTPILNPPQTAILGMHKIEQRAVVIDGEIVARPMMYLALSYDHRMIDGRESVQYLLAIKEALEDPARMILDI